MATDMCKDLLEKAKGGDKGEITIKTSKTGKYGRWIVEIKNVTDELAKIWPYN